MMNENKTVRHAAVALLLLIAWIVMSSPAVSQEQGCFSVIVGKAASTDGYVMMAHNEDDDPPVTVIHHKVPRMNHDPSDRVTLRNGAQLKQVEQTWAYIWSEMPGLLFSDSYLNEWGVCVASDNCPSREDKPELTDGGINYMLRRLVIERAKSSREGVRIAGELVERFGYDASGRTYLIADPDEGWLFCAVNGKHWLAARVPDDEVAMVANTYSVREVDLADTLNYLASEDIVEYAVARGWYRPQDGPFDFARVYAHPETVADSSNICRQWGGLRFVSTIDIPLGTDLPCSVKPAGKLAVHDILNIIRDQYESTELYLADSTTGNPFKAGPNTICNATTQTSFVAQLRRGMPLDIGLVYWVCLSSPSSSVFVPFHFGTREFPDDYRLVADGGSDSQESPFAFDMFWQLQHKVDSVYEQRIETIRNRLDTIEARALALQAEVEQTARRTYGVDKELSLQMLENFSVGLYLSAKSEVEVMLSDW